ncbi:type II secretion system F family protein [Microbacterium sp. T2.11-28]|uniref:type II secretion system F family protein n=1 Tax=Microbacterium sp. T2.11-28 TaxID=3041169 RepID=UPI0024777A50|nr:type II secretion system F family protein [Microbacterium sp. T2.11-28]CAI9386540.1 hypothetical protein MICABA_00450 [Microbacterium sp. T2.11-28]
MTGFSELATAIVLGGALAAGLLLTVSRVPRWGASSLVQRIAPYLRDIGDPRGLTPVAAMPPGAGLRARMAALLARGTDGLARRLAQAGSPLSAVSFRARQLGWTIAGVVGGAVVAVVAAVANGGGAGAALLAPLLGVGAAVGYDSRLGRAAARRKARIEEELPTVLEFLSLCLSAGEGLRDALHRVGEVGTGELTRELRRAVLDTGTGSSLADALRAVAQRLDVASLSRAVDHLVAAIDRGAPLAQVLQDQAIDARDDAKRALIELAGRKEIAMLLPLVFLLLPLSVLFAVFPGVVMLRLGVQ